MATQAVDQTRGGAWSRAAWRCVGYGLFALGFIGLLLPLLPTTIFWILAVLALHKSDPAMAARIRAWPHVGPAVCAYLDDGVISVRGKIAALVAIGVSAAILYLVIEAALPFYLALACLTGAAMFIATRRSQPA